MSGYRPRPTRGRHLQRATRGPLRRVVAFVETGVVPFCLLECGHEIPDPWKNARRQSSFGRMRCTACRRHQEKEAT